MIIELIPISKLKLLDKNPRSITKEQMGKLCKSIQEDPEFLNARPILVNKTGDLLQIYAGNQRVRAAKKLKMKEIPCIVEEDLCPEIMRKRTILDNSHFGEWDWDLLGNEFDAEILIDCGFKAEEILGDLSNISDDPRAKDKEEKKKCELCGK